MWFSLEGRRLFLWCGPTDMRKSFHGLGGIVEQRMDGRLLSGDVFIFVNRRGDRLKMLMWDKTGFLIWYKRLEEGTFEIPEKADGKVELTRTQLMLILEGISLASVRQRKRYTLA